jgi:hypothetical protein
LGAARSLRDRSGDETLKCFKISRGQLTRIMRWGLAGVA